MLPRLKQPNRLTHTDQHPHRIRPSRQRLPKNNKIRLHILRVVSHEIPRPPKPALDLVRDEEDVVYRTQPPDSFEVAGRRKDSAGVAFDRLNHEGGDFVAVASERCFKVFGVAEAHGLSGDGRPDVRDEGAAVCLIVNVR